MQGEPTLQAALECIDRVINKIKPETSSKMKSAVVALYTSDQQGGLRYSTQICIMHLDYDRHIKTTFLRFYHIERLSLLFEVQLYYGFLDSYGVKDKGNNLWGFDLWRDGTICIQFRNELEALLFAKKLEQCAPKREQLLELSKRQVEEELRKRKENSFFGKIKNIFRKSETMKTESVVIDVVKSNSVSIDKQGNFHTQSISPEWEEILRRSGLKPADMHDKQIAQMVLEETIIYETKKAAESDPTILASAGLTCIQDLEEPEEEPEEPKQKQSVKPPQTVQVVDNEQASQRKDTSSTLAEALPLPLPLPLPIPPPLLDLPPPELTLPPNYRASVRRQNLLEEIRNNKIKLKPVKTNGTTFQIDASSLNKQQRIDLGNQIRKRLQQRKAALNRHHSSDED